MPSHGISNAIWAGFKSFQASESIAIPSGLVVSYFLSQRRYRCDYRMLKAFVHSMQNLVTKIDEQSTSLNPTHLVWTSPPGAVGFYMHDIPEQVRESGEFTIVLKGFGFYPKGSVIRCFSLFRLQQFLGYLSPQSTPLIHLQHWLPIWFANQTSGSHPFKGFPPPTRQHPDSKHDSQAPHYLVLCSLWG